MNGSEAARSREFVGAGRRRSASLGNLLIVATIPGLLAVDLANGLISQSVPVSPGDAARGLLVLASGLMLLGGRGGTLARLRGWFLALLAVGLVGPALSAFESARLPAVLFDAEKLVKTLNIVLLIAFFSVLYSRLKVTPWFVCTAISGWGVLAAMSLVMFDVLGIGVGTYLDYSSAHKGLFLAQNDLGLGLVISAGVATFQA